MHLLIAAEGGDANPLTVQILPMLFTLAAFGIVFYILATKVWPKITKALDDRQEQIRSGIAAAEKARAEVEAKQAQFDREIAAAREEADRERAQLRTNMQQYREELRQQADQEIARMKERAMRDLETARTAAVADLHSEAARLAASVAGKILKREITATDQQRLVDESLAELGSRN